VIGRRRELTRADVVLRILATGVLLVVTSAFFLRDSFRLLRRGEHGLGNVVRIEERRTRGGRGRTRHAVVRLTGSTTSGECEIDARHDDVVGRSLPMVFLPENPAVCRVDRLASMLGVPGATFALGGALVLGALFAYDRERRRARRS
jgi:hypothetical protein